jgi:hypothetical protein
MHTPELLAVLQDYRQKGFITRHDWSAKRYTTRKTTDYAAKIDCAARSRGVDDFAIFASIDEIVLGGENEHLSVALEACNARTMSRDSKIGCSVESNAYSRHGEQDPKNTFILEQYNLLDSSSPVVHNYLINVKSLTTPLWYEASSEMKEVTEALPRNTAEVRRCKGLLTEGRKLYNTNSIGNLSPLPSRLMSTIREKTKGDVVFNLL